MVSNDKTKLGGMNDRKKGSSPESIVREIKRLPAGVS